MVIINYILFVLIFSFLVFTLSQIITKTSFKTLKESDQVDTDEENVDSRLKLGAKLQAAGLIIPSITFFVIMTIALIGYIDMILIFAIPLSFLTGLISSINSLRYVKEKYVSIIGILINAFFFFGAMILLLGVKS